MQTEQFSWVARTDPSLGALLHSLFSPTLTPHIGSRCTNSVMSAERCENWHHISPFLGWSFPHVHPQQNARVSQQHCVRCRCTHGAVVESSPAPCSSNCPVCWSSRRQQHPERLSQGSQAGLGTSEEQGDVGYPCGGQPRRWPLAGGAGRAPSSQPQSLAGG